ncbi:MAG: TonB family protein [Proteobacteria bacterium]|nr:TonB family protein [Pseudomonadota bacterium]
MLDEWPTFAGYHRSSKLIPAQVIDRKLQSESSLETCPIKRFSVTASCLFAGLMMLVGTGCATSSSTSTGNWPEVVAPADQMKLAGPLRIKVPVRDSRDAQPSATSLLRVHVDSEGGVRKTSLVESSGSAALDAAAARSLFDARFVPYSSGGVPVAVTTVLPLHFRASSQCAAIGPFNC